MVEANKKEVKYIYGNVAYDIEPAPKKRSTTKVVPKKKTAPTIRLKLMARILMIFMLSFLLVFRFALVMQLTEDIRTAKAQISTLSNSNDDIRIQLAQANNLRKIDTVAVKSCGMVAPTQSDIVYVSVKPLTAATERYSQNTYQMIQKVLGLIY